MRPMRRPRLRVTRMRLRISRSRRSWCPLAFISASILGSSGSGSGIGEFYSAGVWSSIRSGPDW